ncbi:hypothetical protein [Tessaracoccus sp. G1721]
MTHPGPVTAADLLAGPRGRRLCLEWARQALEDLASDISDAAYRLDPGSGTSRIRFTIGPGPVEPRSVRADRVATALARAELPPVSGPTVWMALGESVGSARYWQEPDGEDVLAATPSVRAALAAVAEAIATSGHVAWWTEGFTASTQFRTLMRDPGLKRRRAAPDELLRAWRTGAVEWEARAAREFPVDPTAPYSGEWWSIPPHDLPRTTRSLDVGPLGLWLIEDEAGWQEAATVAVEVPEGLRVLEVRGPDDWAELCSRHPLRVTASRRHDWYRTTGLGAVEWVIPDWVGVAGEFDVVHVPVAGWLTTAGVAVTVDEGVASVLAGWDPGAAYWLTSSPRDVGEQTLWRWHPREDRWLLSRADRGHAGS